MQPFDLKKTFAKYAGREVDATETVHQTKWGDFTSVHLNQADPVLTSLFQEAAQAGLEVRLWTPGTAGTCDHVVTRLNVYVEKEPDGKYRITDNFHLG